MDIYSTKICQKCFSAQDPHSRFCDNCGKAFAETAATDGNISMITKTFIKRQVSETRPFFWLCIIIVGMLGVFGFAQAGVFRGGTEPAPAATTQAPVTLVSKEQPMVQSSTENAPAASDTMLDLNNSVFEMNESGQRSQTPAKRRTHLAAKPTTEPAKTAEATSTNSAPAPPEPTVAKVPEKETAKPAENAAAGPRTYQKGPMGGCFYISASGSKRYVDRGMCN